LAPYCRSDHIQAVVLCPRCGITSSSYSLRSLSGPLKSIAEYLATISCVNHLFGRYDYLLCLSLSLFLQWLYGSPETWSYRHRFTFTLYTRKVNISVNKVEIRGKLRNTVQNSSFINGLAPSSTIVDLAARVRSSK